MPVTRMSTKCKNARPKTESLTRPTALQRSNGLKRVFTDAVLTIKPHYAALIFRREKNHEFRSYKLRPGVTRLWLYESAPTCAITYVVETTEPKVPGQLRDPSGAGNDAFDAGQMTTYAYPIRALYKLGTPITREELKASYGVRSPQGFCYAIQQMVQERSLEHMERVY